MADIFLSYSSKDKGRLAPFQSLFKEKGWTVWSDAHIPVGKSYHAFIDEELEKARCVIVFWSVNSIKSNWVKNEAEEAEKRNILVPVLIDNVPIPLAYRHLECAHLENWNGEPDHLELQLLLNSIQAVIGNMETATLRADQDADDKRLSSAGSQTFSKTASLSVVHWNRNRIAIVAFIGIVAVTIAGWMWFSNKNQEHVKNTADSTINDLPAVQANVGDTSSALAQQYVTGIDISQHDNIDWAKVDNKEIRFVYIRASFGSGVIDKAFKNNWQKAKAAGLLTGAYHVFSPQISEVEQANLFLEIVHMGENDLAPVLDIEYDDQYLKDSLILNRIRNWLTIVESKLMRRPTLYFSVGFWRRFISNTDKLASGYLSLANRYNLWIANYTKHMDGMPHGWKPWTFWQAGDRAQFPFSESPLDINYFNGKFEDLLLFIRSN